MGVIAEAMMEYARPLLESTDGSREQMERALTISQLCWNMAILPFEKQAELLTEIRQIFVQMDEDTFTEFLRDVVGPMMRRHYELFPGMHRPRAAETKQPPSPSPKTSQTTKYPGTGRNAPCPCGSGKKYKHCCARS